LWDYWPLRGMAVRDQKLTDATEPVAIFPQRSLSWLVREKLPLFALSTASAVITMRAQLLGGGINSDVSLSSRVANAIVSYVRYLGQVFWPAHLAPIYPFSVSALKAWEVAGAAVFLISVSALVIAGRRHRYLPVGWFWFVGTLVPMIGLVQVGRQAMADRYAYLPFVGLFIMICWGVADCAKRLHISAAWQTSISVGALLVLATVTHRQIGFWSDSVKLWTHTLLVTTDNYQAEDNLGRALEAEGNRQEALLHYVRAADIEPSYVFAHIHVGTCQHLQGDLQGALQQYHEVIRLTQNDIAHYAEVRRLIFANMASAYAGLGDFLRARECLESVVSLKENDPEEWTNLAIMAQKTGDLDRSIQAYAQAVKLQPTQRGFQLLAQALQQAGRQQEAQAALQQAVALQGDVRKAE
jgi:protein O-mannosyl-transferase